MPYYKLDANLVAGVVNTLKQIDVRGYESMDRLVGLVMLFENILKTNPEETGTSNVEVVEES